MRRWNSYQREPHGEERPHSQTKLGQKSVAENDPAFTRKQEKIPKHRKMSSHVSRFGRRWFVRLLPGEDNIE